MCIFLYVIVLYCKYLISLKKTNIGTHLMVLLGWDMGVDRAAPGGACRVAVLPGSISPGAWSRVTLVSQLLKQENTEAGHFLPVCHVWVINLLISWYKFISYLDIYGCGKFQHPCSMAQIACFLTYLLERAQPSQQSIIESKSQSPIFLSVHAMPL